MIKKNIKWTDYAGNPQERDWYFHLTRAEMTEEAIGLLGNDLEEKDIQEKLQALVKTKDNKFIIATFKDLVLKAVGLKSADGSLFINNEENRNLFRYSGAMDELLMWMFMNPYEAGQLIQGMVPPDVLAEAEKAGVIKNGEITTVKAGIDGVDDLKPDPVAPDIPEKLPYGDAVDMNTRIQPEPLDITRVEFIKDQKQYTRAELLNMAQPEFDVLVGTNPQRMSKSVLEIAFLRKTRQ